jgi:hypothetical protein
MRRTTRRGIERESTMKIVTRRSTPPACLSAIAALIVACGQAPSTQLSVQPPSPASPSDDDGRSGEIGNPRELLAGALAFPPDAGSSSDGAPAAEAVVPLADPSDDLLAFGSAETLVDGVTAPEDVLISADERLFVTGNDGVYELKRDPSGTVGATNLLAGQPCIFTGIVEVQATLYVTCADYTNSYLFAASLAGAPAMPSFRKIDTMKGTVLANEIAADPDGRIYVAASLQAEILRLTLSTTDPFTVSAHEVWLLTPSGIFPNGLRYARSRIYWTDSLGGSVNAAAILRGGTAGPITRFVDLDDGFFDDLYVNSNGTILVASYLLGAVRTYGPPPVGGLLAQTPPGAFVNPADVLPAQGRFGLGAHDLVVADKGANRVAAFHLPP